MNTWILKCKAYGAPVSVSVIAVSCDVVVLHAHMRFCHAPHRGAHDIHTHSKLRIASQRHVKRVPMHRMHFVATERHAIFPCCVCVIMGQWQLLHALQGHGGVIMQLRPLAAASVLLCFCCK
jgi:hypothetical protein